MDKTRLERDLYAAFLHAATQMGARVKGMSCFLENWGTLKPIVSATAPQPEKTEIEKARSYLAGTPKNGERSGNGLASQQARGNVEAF